jgi:DNA helicase-2/ATP-dependent DNA helicase PcrA
MKEILLTDSPAFDSNIDYRKELNEEQLAVVENGDGACLVLAGAGSGKTRTITYRVAYLLERGVAPQNILLLTFTNKASKEMLARVESLLGTYPKGLWGGTFHSVANRILRMYADAIGFTQNFTILDSEDSESLIKTILKELQVDTSERRFPSASKLNSILSYARNAGRTIKQIVEEKHEHFFDLIPTIERIGEVYELRKRQADAMDFDDLLIRLRDLLVQNPVVRDRLATQFEYVLVDEYQDTNVLQAQLIAMFASAHKNILVVGDDAQSIYSFRAAEIKNILSFPDQYGSAKTFRLVTNYRSSPEILSIANESIHNNKNQFKKDLTAVRGSSEKPQLVPAANAPQEAQFIAQQITTLRDAGTPLREIAVLFRAAFHSQMLELELMRRDLPYEYRGGLKFFERAHIKDLVMHLRIKANLKDEVAWMRVLGLQTGIGLVTAQKMIQQIHGFDSLEELVEQNIGSGARASAGWKTLAVTLKKFSQQSTPAELIRTVASSDYRAYLEAEYPDFNDRCEDIEQFAVFAEQYKDLTTFLTDVSLTADYGILEEETHGDEERLILSTIHQAKGLEWDAVFIMNLVDGKFPNGRALEERDGLEEERRLFYVATTRARKFLYYTYPLVSGTESLMFNQPSMFLQELDPGMMEEVKLKREVSKTTSWNTTSWDSSEWDSSDLDDGPAIVLDDLGEEVKSGGAGSGSAGKKPMKSPGSFLRDV